MFCWNTFPGNAQRILRIPKNKFYINIMNLQEMDVQQKLLSAVHGGDLELIKEFYRQHSKTMSSTSWKDCVYSKTGDSAIHVAARTGHLHVLK